MLLRPSRGFGVPYSAKSGLDSAGSLEPRGGAGAGPSSYLSSGAALSQQRSLLASIEDDADIYDILKKIIDDSPSSSVQRFQTNGKGHIGNLRALSSRAVTDIQTESTDTQRLDIQASSILTPKRPKAYREGLSQGHGQGQGHGLSDLESLRRNPKASYDKVDSRENSRLNAAEFIIPRERPSLDSTGAQGSRSVDTPVMRMQNRPVYEKSGFKEAMREQREEKIAERMGKLVRGGYGIGGGVVGYTRMDISNPSTGRSYSPHKRAF